MCYVDLKKHGKSFYGSAATQMEYEWYSMYMHFTQLQKNDRYLGRVMQSERQAGFSFSNFLNQYLGICNKIQK